MVGLRSILQITPGSWPVLILLAKSEISMIHVRQALENMLCQRASTREDDFASSISFGECQVMAQLVATRWLVFPLMKKDFRVCHPLLARGDFASATLNHQNWTRAEWH